MLAWRRTAYQGNLGKREYEQLLHEQAWELLKELLKGKYKLNITEADISKNEYGKPYLIQLPNLHFNLTHCEGLVACIISEREVGIDAENIRPFCQKVVRKVCSLEEQEALEQAEEELTGARKLIKVQTDEMFFCLWTLKESYIKAIGKGLSYPMKEISFSWSGKEWIKKEETGADFHQLKLENQFIVSWCEKREKQGGLYEINNNA